MRKIFKNRIEKLSGYFKKGTLLAAIIGVTICQNPFKSNAQENKLYVDDTSPAKIREYYNSIGGEDTLSAQVTYMKKPVLSGKYSAGQLTGTTLNNALKTVNYVRLIAGLPCELKLNKSYNEKIQTGCLINAANNELSHYPDKPKGMSQSMYDLGREGTSGSNLAMGYSSINSSIIYGWMSDSDMYNIPCVGHRRWVLYPSLSKVGFGAVNNYYGMYVFDFEGKEENYKNVIWPAKHMPEGVFSDYDAWSLSTGEYEDIDKIKVTLIHKNTNKKWVLSKGTTKGDFYVDSSGYGMSGSCIIFRPNNGVDTSAGNKYSVKVEGLESGTLTYDVNFFDINTSIKSAKVSLSETVYNYDGKAKRPSVTVKLGGKNLVKGTDYTVKYTNNTKVGKAKVSIVGKGCYKGTINKSFTIASSKTKIKSCVNVKTGIQLKWEKIHNATSYIVLRKIKGESKYTSIATVKNLSYIDKSVTSGKDIIYVVKACAKSKKLAGSSAVKIRCLSAGKINTLRKGSKGILIKWDKVKGASGYAVYRKEDDGKYSKIATVKGNATISFMDKSVADKTDVQYGYAIRPINGQTVGAYVEKTIDV